VRQCALFDLFALRFQTLADRGGTFVHFFTALAVGLEVSFGKPLNLRRSGLAIDLNLVAQLL